MRLLTQYDSVRLLSDRLPSKIAHAEFSKHFPNLNNALLIVIDAETPELAREATEALQKKLVERKDLFTEVYLPGGGSFFERNGLLYRTPEELDYFADQIARVQPILAELEQRPGQAEALGHGPHGPTLLASPDPARGARIPHGAGVRRRAKNR